MATTSNYALRLLALLKTEAEKRTARAKPDGFDRLMETACEKPPRPGDEILPGS